MLIMVFLHAEFISTMKTVQNLTIFVKMQNNRNMNNFGNICEFFVIFTETLEQNIRKSQEMCFFLDGIQVKLFGKNLIFRVKSTIFFWFSGPNIHF